MTLTEILTNRRSTRKFADRPVARETVEKLLALTLDNAPSSKSTRSTRFVVVSDRGALAKMAAMRDFGSAFLASAPCAVVVCGDTSATDLWLDNAAISATILQLAAADAGLASCWVHVNERAQRQAEPNGPSAADHLRGFLAFSADWKPLCAVALGYPLEPSKPHSQRDNSDKVVWL